MQLTDTREIAAPPRDVWRALLDAEVLQTCIPGCREMVGSPEDGFDAVVVQKVGPVKATFRGRVTLSDISPESAVTLTGEGKGGVAGFAKGSAHVKLTETEGATQLAYTVEATIGGKLAQLGSRVIDSFAKKMADEFFTNFQGYLDPEVAEEP